MQYALIGERLAHSFSPELHRSFGRYDYACLELAPSELGSFLKARRFEGLNVTIPYKQAVIPYLDRLDPRAAAIGAVNTVVKRDGLLWGYNTDFGGMAEAICHLLAPLSAGQSPALAGKTLLILGTGGSSKTALAVCAALGATEVFRVSRREQAGVLSYEQLLKRFGGPRPSAGPSAPEAPRQLVILNCTPVGMFPDWERLPLRPAALPGLAGVFDCVYNPLRTRLVLETRGLGLPAGGGLEMLVRQAALACGLFTGSAVEEGQILGTLSALGRSRENLVLIGMPGCGKSTVGSLLAKALGKPFVDLDAVIEARAGKPVAAIFAEAGEGRFRELESALVQELAGQGGQLIATGGGTVLREENLRRLRQNGRIFFLDRPPEALRPSPERPLGDTAEKLRGLYRQRYGLYRAAADCVISCRGTAEQAFTAALAAWRSLE
ncbi:MAG: shikimate dehydrogenase [Oscillospiraceae bacterium]|nr:shikimate dehydrogenase [Oscillospiraceae bacterium]